MPAPFRIKSASVYIDNKKVATCKTGNFEFMNGSESQVVDGGYGGHSDGALLSTLEIEHIYAVTDETSAITEAVTKHKYVKIKFGVVDGKLWEVTGRFVSRSIKWDNKTGSLDGSSKFEGGAVKLT